MLIWIALAILALFLAAYAAAIVILDPGRSHRPRRKASFDQSP